MCTSIVRLYEVTSSSSFTHSFIIDSILEHMFVEYLLCARLGSRYWDIEQGKSDKNACLHGTYILGRRERQ